ncbi:glycosyltransferase family 31 protein [Rhodotorula toruloides]|uniref:Glycosyltransferase family 31 protein n=1 Tax=Rhodotorula toruloides TaxID=5286 RepID=A0A511KGS1_RHOTO|nr:glycosyltransferase family 31 protein [Rhodotorula toruloides]
MLPFAVVHDSQTPPPYSPHSTHSSFPPTRTRSSANGDAAPSPSHFAATHTADSLLADTDSASSASTSSTPPSRPSTDSADGAATGLASFRNRAGGGSMSRLSSGTGTAVSSLSASSSSISAMGAAALGMSALEDGLGGASSSASSTVFTYGGSGGGGAWSGDEGSFGLGLEAGSSRVSSRAHSPAPMSDGGFDGYLSYRAGSRNRSRNTSGYTTPVEKEHAYGSEYYHNHHYQTSALLSKLGGTLAPETSPVIGRKQRKPGWWARRAETRRKNTGPRSSASSGGESSAPLLGGVQGSSASKTGKDRTCFATFLAALLRQPWFPTQPFTILFSLLLFGCFAATLTTFLVNVLSSDREPPPWRQYCQEQRPFPHDLADSLKPVNVFVGVFSVDAAAERRNAIRLSYAKHSKPIDPRTGTAAHNVQLKFVLGRPRQKWSKRIALEMEMFNDIVVLDVEENMNKGKTFRYFSWAAENATVPVFYALPGEEGLVDGQRQVGVGFRKADYVVKADDDSFIDLGELERHLRITPRENTYWGYLVRNRFMAGEVYALSSDLVSYLATYPRPKSWTIGKEDQRVAKWMRNHPNASSIHWISERCYIYDHPKAGTTYSRGFTFPDHVEQVRLEGRRGISEEERLRRGGELWQSYSTVARWKKPYVAPAQGLSIEEEVEALVEGGGRWAAQGWRSDGGRGPEAVKLEKVVFGPSSDARFVDHLTDSAGLDSEPDKTMTGVQPGVPDRGVAIPSARTTRFGKDLFRDPEGVRAVSHLRKRAANVQQGPTRAPLEEGEYEIHNLVRGPFEDAPSPADGAAGESTGAQVTLNSTLGSTSSLPGSSSAAPHTAVPYVNEPTAQIRLGQHAYAVPSYNERFVPAPTLRFDPATLSVRERRMLGRDHGGTVAVHYLKRNEWFFETALALLGREKMWDGGADVPAYPATPYSSNSLLEPYAKDPLVLTSTPPAHLAQRLEQDDAQVSANDRLEVFPALWGAPRMYGSPIVLANGMIVEGRRAEANRERLVGPPGTRLGAGAGAGAASTSAGVASRLGRITGGGRMPMMALAEEDGVQIEIGDEERRQAGEDEVALEVPVVEESALASSPVSSSASSTSAPSSPATSSDAPSAPSTSDAPSSSISASSA